MFKEENLLLIDKPAGMTSFDVIRKLRRQTGIRKYGHAGTLDPAATGLMILGVNEGTKKLTEFIKLDKEYEAEILLGRETATDDIDGPILQEKEVFKKISTDIAKNTLQGMIGDLQLPVSAYSAIKKNGVPMYKRARQAAKEGGSITDVPIRTMTVYEAELLNNEMVKIEQKQLQLLKVRFSVASGTYIRSLAKELGLRLSYPASLYSLRRTKIGRYSLDDAVPLAEYKK